MNRAERIFRLHYLLKGCKPVSFAHLKQELGMSRATVRREIEYMRDFMDAPILYDRERNGYRYDPQAAEFELPGLWFNPSELYALLASEQLLETVQPGLLTPYIGPLRARIRKLLEQSGHNADTVTTRIQLQAVAQRQAEPQRFGMVAGATLAGHVLSLEYHGRGRGAATQRRVHPQRLLHYRGNWYLIAWCEQAVDLRTFALERIRKMEVLDEAARSVDPERLSRHFGATFGIFTGEAGDWAVLRFNASAARWVADEHWHPDQIGQWRDGNYELQIPYSDPRELIMDILKFGPDVEVVAPPELREAVAQRVRETGARYQ